MGSETRRNGRRQRVSVGARFGRAEGVLTGHDVGDRSEEKSVESRVVPGDLKREGDEVRNRIREEGERKRGRNEHG